MLRRGCDSWRYAVRARGCVASLLWMLLAPALVVAATEPQGEAQRRLLVPSQATGSVRLEPAVDPFGVLAELEMERGKSLPVTTAFQVKRVSVGDPAILDVVVVSPRALQFVPTKIGVTNVVIWDAENRPQAVIDVHVGTAHTQITSALRRTLRNEEIEVESVGDSVALRGPVANALAMEHALEVVRALLPKEKRDRVINLLEVGGGQQVILEVVIAEMNRSLRRDLGTNFHTITGSDGTVFEFFNFLGGLTSLSKREFSFDLSNFDLTDLDTVIGISDAITFGGAGFGVGSGIYEVFFALLEEEGLGKVLAEPTLISRSGETASFLVGGEVPIPIAQSGGFGAITIEFKDFGVGLAFTPTVMTPDRIHLRVTPEVSEPVFALGETLGGTVVPAFRTRRASTTIELGDGQSFAIAGLLSEQVNENASKYPVLGDLPVLGTLFRSTTFQKEETELVMMVTPRIVKPLPPGPHPLPTDHFIEPSAFEFYLLGRLEARAEAVALPTPPDGPDAPDPRSFGGIIGGAGHRVASSPEEETE